MAEARVSPPLAERYEQVRNISAEMLASFFQALSDRGDQAFFHPHPLTVEEARLRCEYAGADVYVVQLVGSTITGYGMLRGWDEGFAVPSLGIAIHPDFRGSGLGRKLMLHLHKQARLKGAHQVRLTVEKANRAARTLYEQLGYRFTALEEGKRLVGVLTLDRQGKQ